MTRTRCARTRAAVGAGAATLLLLAAVLSRAAEPAAADLAVRTRARAIQPGEVVELTLTLDRPIRTAEVRAFDHVFQAYPLKNAVVWQALVGIDLEVKPGIYEAKATAETADGSTVTGAATLNVKPRSFPVRRLTVDERFVTPPPEVEERIKRETQRITAIHAAVSARRLWDGRFIAPVRVPPGSSFGKRSVLNGKPRNPHTGVDFGAPAGTPVAAPNDGRVVLAGELYYSGNTVILDHGLGLYSLFAHLSRIDVREGDVVRVSQVVGLVGSTGRSTGPHLHWSVRLSQCRVDPMALVALTGPQARTPIRKRR